ncbi:hypothetical protein [Brevundimonas sp. R86498]|uniref:hypothetical protein n=1 Tax=Brevundimonas sp. R86498 TaxID=3093845 RepID=UPI0037CB09D7
MAALFLAALSAGALLVDPATAPQDHSGHAGHSAAQPVDHSAHTAMTSPLGPWPLSRDASGTSWQPDTSVHGGLHGRIGDWSTMSHALLNLTWNRQSGPRGDDRTFVSGMVMGAARRDFADGSALNLRAMLSPDPLMGKDGYPLLLAAGETADGVHPLLDRQHPHELVMELSASYARPLSATDSVFAYIGLPGEPAFGPPAFMHRMSAMDSPEAPITHHWLELDPHRVRGGDPGLGARAAEAGGVVLPRAGAGSGPVRHRAA